MPSGLLTSHHVQDQQGQLPAPSLAMSDAKRSPQMISLRKRISNWLFLHIGVPLLTTGFPFQWHVLMILGLHILRTAPTMAKRHLSTAFSHVLMTLLKPRYKIDPPKSNLGSLPNKSASATEAALLNEVVWRWKFHNASKLETLVRDGFIVLYRVFSMFHPIFPKKSAIKSDPIRILQATHHIRPWMQQGDRQIPTTPGFTKAKGGVVTWGMKDDEGWWRMKGMKWWEI